MTGARDEVLRTGRLGPAGAALLYRTVGQVVRMRNLPPPPGCDRWDEDAVTEVGNEVFVGRDGHARFVALAATSFDEDSFRSGLWTAVARDLTSQGRRTERGSLADRVRGVLDNVPGVIENAGRWTLPITTADGEPRYDELVAAAAATPIIVPPWAEDSPRRAPLADRPSFVALIEAVLGLCPTGLPLAELVDVLAVRLGVHDLPLPHDHTMLDEYGTSISADPAKLTAARDDAIDLVKALTPAQRLVLPHLEAPATELASLTGLGRTKAWKTAAEVRDVLTERLRDHPERAAVFAAASELLLDGGGK
jgi:hypothetical protein